MFSLNRLFLSGLILSFGFCGQAFAGVSAVKCSAKVLKWPQVGEVTVSVCLGQLMVMSNGKVLFNSNRLENDDGWVAVESLGAFSLDAQRNALVVRFNATEGVAEYEGDTKGVLYFDGKTWRVECDAETCEMLPSPPPSKAAPLKMPKIANCKAAEGAYKFSKSQRHPKKIAAVGCTKTNALHVMMDNRVFDPFEEFEERGTFEFQDLRTVKTGKDTSELRVTVIETTIPGPPAGMGDPEPAETKKAKARVVATKNGVSLRCAQKRCLVLPK